MARITFVPGSNSTSPGFLGPVKASIFSFRAALSRATQRLPPPRSPALLVEISSLDAGSIGLLVHRTYTSPISIYLSLLADAESQKSLGSSPAKPRCHLRNVIIESHRNQITCGNRERRGTSPVKRRLTHTHTHTAIDPARRYQDGFYFGLLLPLLCFRLGPGEIDYS